VALRSRAGNYTIISSIPAVSEAQLAAAPSWGEELPLPEDYAIHLQLPDTVTTRTRQLATQVTGEQETLYGKAQAIETYLRQYEYDLNISEPPATVDDVADYFLFDLRKGYCDYYTTAFIVMARLAGLPARFATGYTAGAWDPSGQAWVITEAAAHSWPEVYFPDYGWIPFEPTASRPTLSRIGLPESNGALAVPAVPMPTTPVEDRIAWNWQMVFWLFPLALLCWGGFTLFERWRTLREDPWLGLLRWGKRAGRPLVQGETVTEYGKGLAAHVVSRQTQEMDTGRIIAREITALSSAVNSVRYGLAAERSAAAGRALEHWQRLRGYLAQRARRF
jgi:transglutaminase-like putative cysteine protease